MLTLDTALLHDVLSLPPNALAYAMSARLAARLPGRAILETTDIAFDLERFQRRGHCVVTSSKAVHVAAQHRYDGRRARSEREVEHALRAVAWNGQLVEVLTIRYNDGCDVTRHFVIAEREPVARAFFEAVAREAHILRDEVLVFHDGAWERSEQLYADIQRARLEDLVLEEGLARRLTHDFERWRSSRELYETHGIAWKRGVLLLGPPGNGKSHFVRAIIRHLALPCLYVRSFRAQYSTDHENVRRVFLHAREIAPCLLVLEDLDALVTDQNRSVVLNELDGFATNTGLLTVATTNHPERLDPALLARPSRFDRKYTFACPALEERARYLALRNAGLRLSVRMTAEEIRALAELTSGFSYAYLQELVLSALMSWVGDGADGRLAAAALAEVEGLRREMGVRRDEPAPITPSLPAWLALPASGESGDE